MGVGVLREGTYQAEELFLGSCQVHLRGPEAPVARVAQVLRSVALPNDDFPQVTVTIAPDRTVASGGAIGGPQWSVRLPQRGWLPVVVGQVVATVTALLQRHLFVHAGTVAFNGQACVLVGDSGTGKTSTVAALVREGGVFLSDEVAILDPEARTIAPFALPMAVKPWTLAAAGDLPPGQEVAREGGVRYSLPTSMCPTALPVGTVVLLKPTRGPGRLEPLPRAEMLVELARHVSSFTYRHRCEDAFIGFGGLLRTTRCYVLESSHPAKRIDLLSNILS